MTDLVAVKRYDDLAVDTTWTRITYRPGSEADVNVFVSAPEYGRGFVMAVGFKVKRDGTRGRQMVKPLMRFNSCPVEVQAAFTAAGYGAEALRA